MSGFIWSIVYFAGVLLIFIGERMVGSGSWRGLGVAGLVAIISAMIARAVRMRNAQGERKKTELIFLTLYAVGLGAIFLYGFQSDLSASLFGKPLEKDWPKLAVMLQALWPALFTISTAAIALTEMAYASVARAPEIDRGRIGDALLSGIGLGAALVFVFSITYVATQRDKKVDLAYFRTAKAGESTHKIVHLLDQNVDVALFFPPASEVRDEVEGYFKDLQQESTFLKVGVYDYALDPQKAKEFGVSGNGTVVIARDKRHEPISIGVDFEAARTQLRNLDKEVQKRLLLVARPQRVVYFTSGHGERTQQPTDENDKRATDKEVRDLLTQQAYQMRNLGAGEGLVTDVPADATVVMILGPQKPFLDAELTSLERYIARGGRLFIALDPESGVDLKPLLDKLGVKFVPTVLANDQFHLSVSGAPSEKTKTVAIGFSSHPSVTSFSHMGRPAMVMDGAGSFEALKDKPKDVTVDFTVHSPATTWADANGNFTFDAPAEVRKTFELGVAIVKKAPEEKAPAPAKDAAGKVIPPKDTKNLDGRVVLFADSDAFSDHLFGALGNPYFIYDGMKWLSGDEAITGEVSSETDVPIAHTRKQDVAWFYSTIFLAPLAVMGIGSVVTRRGRKQRKRPNSVHNKEAA